MRGFFPGHKARKQDLFWKMGRDGHPAQPASPAQDWGEPQGWQAVRQGMRGRLASHDAPNPSLARQRGRRMQRRSVLWLLLWGSVVPPGAPPGAAAQPLHLSPGRQAGGGQPDPPQPS